MLDGFCGGRCGGGGGGVFSGFGVAGVDDYLDEGFDLGAEEVTDEADEDEECDDEEGEVGCWGGHFGMQRNTMFVVGDEVDFTKQQLSFHFFFFLYNCFIYLTVFILFVLFGCGDSTT